MTMVYLANVPSIETDRGMMFYTPHNHVEVIYPSQGDPVYWVFSFHGIEPTRGFPHFHQAMDFASRVLKQAEPA